MVRIKIGTFVKCDKEILIQMVNEKDKLQKHMHSVTIFMEKSKETKLGVGEKAEGERQWEQCKQCTKKHIYLLGKKKYIISLIGIVTNPCCIMNIS
jgi:hypothetical protein